LTCSLHLFNLYSKIPHLLWDINLPWNKYMLHVILNEHVNVIYVKTLNDYQIKPHNLKCSLPTYSWLKNWYCIIFTARCSFHISFGYDVFKLITSFPIWHPEKFNCHVIEMKRRYCNTTMSSFLSYNLA